MQLTKNPDNLQINQPWLIEEQNKIILTLLIVFNIGAELIGFSLLFISVFLIALWFYKKTQRYFIITIILC